MNTPYGRPGAFQLLNVLAPEECQRLVELSERLGYLKDAPVSLPREVRHNDNVTWVTDEETDRLIWSRVAHFCGQNPEWFHNQEAVGINARFRFYRYGPGDFFKPLLLSGDFDGGATRFFVPSDDQIASLRNRESLREVDVRTPAGGVFCFPHGRHPMHCLHSSQPIRTGTKYIIRTDMLFTLK